MYFGITTLFSLMLFVPLLPSHPQKHVHNALDTHVEISLHFIILLFHLIFLAFCKIKAKEISLFAGNFVISKVRLFLSRSH